MVYANNPFLVEAGPGRGPWGQNEKVKIVNNRTEGWKLRDQEAKDGHHFWLGSFIQTNFTRVS